MVTQKTGVTEEPATSGRRDAKTLAFVAFVCLSILTLTVRRHAKTVVRSEVGIMQAASVGAAAQSFADPLILKLASITQQTPDAKTLRFIMPKGRTLSSRPG